MLSRRSAKRALARCAEDGRSIPLCEATSFQQGDPSTSLQNADALLASLGMTLQRSMTKAKEYRTRTARPYEAIASLRDGVRNRPVTLLGFARMSSTVPVATISPPPSPPSGPRSMM
jgi:hypothetical protein